jgi:hypothetical protein
MENEMTKSESEIRLKFCGYVSVGWLGSRLVLDDCLRRLRSKGKPGGQTRGQSLVPIGFTTRDCAGADVTTICGRFSKKQTEPQLQRPTDHGSAKRGVPLSRALVTNNWRKLSKAARQEHDPKKFVFLLKQLYDVVNKGEKGRRVSDKANRRLAKAA